MKVSKTDKMNQQKTIEFQGKESLQSAKEEILCQAWKDRKKVALAGKYNQTDTSRLSKKPLVTERLEYFAGVKLRPSATCTEALGNRFSVNWEF